MQLYYIDKIHIYLEIDYQELTLLMPLDELKNESHFLIIKGIDLFFKMRSLIIATAPTDKFFKILDKSCEGISHHITYLEIAKETECENVCQAEIKRRDLRDKTYMKYARRSIDKKSDFENPKYRLSKDRSLIGEETNYNFTKRCKQATYVRSSKITNTPCLHEEWRLISACRIKELTGITAISDILTTKLELTHKAIEDKYVKHFNDVNWNRIGITLLGWDKKKTFTKREDMRHQLYTTTWLTAHGITCYAVFASKVKEFAKNINKKPGPTTRFEKRMLKLNRNKHNMILTKN